MAANVDAIEYRCRKGLITLPYVSAFPASFDVMAACAGFFPAAGNRCPSTVSYGSLSDTFSDSGTFGGIDTCPMPDPAITWSIDWSVSLSSVGDNGDGTWRYEVHVAATPTNTLIQNLYVRLFSAGITYEDGDFIDLPYLETLSPDGEFGCERATPCASGTTAYFGATDPLTGGIDFTPLGFYGWNVESLFADAWGEFANIHAGSDDRFACPRVASSTYCKAPVATTGVLEYQRMEWRASISGCTPFTTKDVYFNLEERATIGSGSYADLGSAILNPVMCDAAGSATTPWTWLDLNTTLSEVRLLSVGFTGPIGPGP